MSASLAAKARPLRFKLTPPEPDEDALHASVKAVLDLLLLPPAQWTTFPAGGLLSPQAASRLWRLGLKPGWPDILIVHNSALFGVELKTRTGRLSKSRTVRTRSGRARHVTGQVEMLADLQRAGVRTAVCRSVDDVLAQLKSWNIPTRATAR
jgi:hypothetical protein